VKNKTQKKTLSKKSKSIKFKSKLKVPSAGKELEKIKILAQEKT